jgi:lipopolysaccharide biosynthesis glycosyltransferase
VRVRKQFADILVRYLDGDLTLCTEIEENKAMGKQASYMKFAQNLEEDEYDKYIPKIAYIYATKSPAFPGLIKIGRTIDMNARLSCLNVACAPAPFEVVAMVATLDMKRDEHAAHEFFASVRKEGEFFAVTDQEVKNYFITHLMPQHQEDMIKHMAWTQYQTRST